MFYSFRHFGLCTHDKIGQDMKFDMKHQLLFTIQCGDQSYKKKTSKYVMQVLGSCKKTCREYMGFAKSFLHIHNKNLSS